MYIVLETFASILSLDVLSLIAYILMSYLLDPYYSYVNLHLLMWGGGQVCHPSECLSHSEGFLFSGIMYAAYVLKTIIMIWCAVTDS